MSRNFADRFGQALGGRAELAAAVDVDLGRAREASSQLPGCRAYRHYQDALPDIDAALVVLPHQLHHEVGLACLAAGKHVMIEKPLANSDSQCRDLIRAADDAQRVLMVAYVMRYHPLVRCFVEAIHGGLAGEVFQVSIWTEQFTKYEPGHWTRDEDTLGGGQLFSHGCHYIDLLLAILGRPVEGSHMGTQLGVPWVPREGTSNVSLRFESGAMGYHFGTWGARGTKLRYAMHAHGTGGMLELDLAKGRLVLHRDHGTGTLPAESESLDAYELGHQQMTGEGADEEVLMSLDPGKHTEHELSHFLDCIETGKKPLTDGRQSLQGLRVIWRLYEAERAGKMADLRGLGLCGTEPVAASLLQKARVPQGGLPDLGTVAVI